VPAGRVRSLDEVYEWEQTRSQGLLVDVEHPTMGTVTLPGPPLRFFTASESSSPGAGAAGSGPSGDGPVEVTRRRHAAPPTLGQHDEAVRAWLDV
jgi:CoA-transferase family III